MSVEIGARIGSYEVVSRLGEGGMGVVYRAHDTTLRRDVAIKTLPALVANDRDRLARFQREAQALASLNHPHIAQIYGFEVHAGRPCLAMELIEGDTLQERLARGPMTIDETLRAARQLAEALEAAHERGVVHRDLKPQNIKITPHGDVKVLDFGLAKVLSQGVEAIADLSRSPTLSLAATEVGAILGTAAFMAPEQAKGKTVDHRADVWAFGAVVYQMLTGKQLFAGETTSETLAQVMLQEPEWRALPPHTPARLAEVLRRCLVKDPRHRLQAIGDARIAIDEVIAGAADPVPPVPRASRWRTLAWSGGALLLGAAASAAVLLPRTAPPVASEPVTRWTVPLDADERVAFGRLVDLGIGRPSVALSPDGRRLVYVAERGDRTQLYLRGLDAFDAVPIAGTEGGFQPFFSPDGQSVGFFTDTQLRRVFLQGGSPVALAEATNVYGASWASDGHIYFADREASRLRRVPAEGGNVETVARSIDAGTAFRWPHYLPGSHALLYTADTGAGWVNVLRLADATHHPLVAGTGAQYVPTGHLVFARGGDLFAATFDLERLEITGPAVLVLPGVRTEGTDAPQLAIAANGTIAYVAGGYERLTQFVWVDRHGAEESVNAPVRVHGQFKLSPDGQRIAATILPQAEGQTLETWIYDPERDTRTRLAMGAERVVWAPDGRHVYYLSERGGVFNIVRQATDGVGEPEPVASVPQFSWIRALSPDGNSLIVNMQSVDRGWDLWSVPLHGNGTLAPFLQTPADDMFAAFSPDGRWFAYVSDESGRYEVYVVAADRSGDRRQISTEGGEEPRWSQQGTELFYRNYQRWMTVPVTTGETLTVGRAELLFEGPYPNVPGWSYDVSPDGRRFLLVKEAVPSNSREIRIVQHWVGEMQQRVSAAEGR